MTLTFNFSHKDPNQLMEIVNTELKKLSSWFQANKLSINIKKSNFILFKTKQNRQELDVYFSINDSEIDRVNKVLLLGVILDEHLPWKIIISKHGTRIFFPITILF